jgi:hypothetical protein
MTAGARVFARVTIQRTIATQRHAALLTCAQVHPLRASLHALGAFANLRLLDWFDRVEMRTAATAHDDLLLFVAANRS